MSFVNIFILAIIQGLAELLPISSSAHVVVAEKLMGLDPSSPPITMLLVMLHTGTMFAVLVYFWRRWQTTFFQNATAFRTFAWQAVAATVATGIVGEGIIKLIEKTAFRGLPNAEIEDLFSHLELIAPALAAAGVLILIAGLYEKRHRARDARELTMKQCLLIGLIQGFCLPFRGFSRSGATISTGMLGGAPKPLVESFSFALAVILTGAVLAFLAGLAALKWLSSWLEGGNWYLFGIYCLAAAAVVGVLHFAGY
jgi:undecaprenyl-diphosphatase